MLSPRKHAHAGPDQLQHVLVACHQDQLDWLLSQPVGERAEHVVGLEAGHFEKRQPKRFEHPLDESDLTAEIVRHAGTGLLVGRQLLFPERRPRRVPRHGPVRRLLLAEELQQHG